MNVFSQAEAWGIDPTRAALASLSNLRSAVAECKRVINRGDKNRLANIFYLCATQTNIELRLALDIPSREEAHSSRRGDRVEVVLTPEQYEQIQRKTRLQLRFTEAPPVRYFCDITPVQGSQASYHSPRKCF